MERFCDACIDTIEKGKPYAILRWYDGKSNKAAAEQEKTNCLCQECAKEAMNK